MHPAPRLPCSISGTSIHCPFDRPSLLYVVSFESAQRGLERLDAFQLKIRTNDPRYNKKTMHITETGITAYTIDIIMY